MTHNIDLLGTSKEKNVKDLIINALTIEWPLSLKKLYNLLKKRYRTKVSYQAVHKALQELVDKEVIVKNKMEYSLNLDWIKNLREFSEEIEKSYLNKSPLIDLSIEDSKSFVFNNLVELDKFLMLAIEKFLTTKEYEKIPCYSYWNFEWWPLFVSKQEYSVLREIINPKRIYMAVKDKSIIARFCSSFYDKIGAKVKNNIKLESNFDFVVLGDLVFQMYFPEKLIKKLEIYFNSLNNLEELDMHKLVKIFEEKNKINLLAVRNKDIADLLAEKVRRVFN